MSASSKAPQIRHERVSPGHGLRTCIATKPGAGDGTRFAEFARRCKHYALAARPVSKHAGVEARVAGD
jgi:hypothetical protein